MMSLEKISRFAMSLKESGADYALIQRWLVVVEEEHNEILKKGIFLARYYEKMPKALIPEYANTLLEILRYVKTRPIVELTETTKEDIEKFVIFLRKEGMKKEGKEIHDLLKHVPTWQPTVFPSTRG